MPSADGINRVRIGDFATASISRRSLAERMAEDCLRARQDRANWLPKVVLSSNGQGVALAGENPAFMQVMNQADIIHADGMSIVLASKLTRIPLPERVATTDFFHDAAEVASLRGLSFYILGSSAKQNEMAVQAIRKQYPNVKIAGQRDGYFKDSEDAAVCADIRASGADVLWVALGKPKQEFWAIRNRENLRGVGWIKTCGGLYAFLAGDSPRAPDWMQAWGFEWLFRALREPYRLGWRYLTTNPYAFYRLLRYTEWRKWHWQT